jgi:glycosyltransferase involved in cell wall biosynthesis
MTAPWLTLPVWHYCPIEGDNLPVSWRDIWNDPSNGGTPVQFLPVAMSEYGRRVISGHIGRDVPMIYHGVDTDAFRPATPTDPIRWEGRRIGTKEQAKAAFGFAPDSRVILRYDRHVPRKFYNLFLQAMTPVLLADPKAVVLVHCRPQDEGGNLLEEVARQPHEVWGQIKFTDAHDTWKGLPTEGLVALINAADIYVSTTSGEGFGLTLAESLACGVPVVVTDWAAEREVVGPGGVLVPPLRDTYGDVVRYHSTYGMDWAVPDARGFTQPVLDLLAKPQRARALGDAGRRHVRASFSWSNAADQFVSLFEAASLVEVAA